MNSDFNKTTAGRALWTSLIATAVAEVATLPIYTLKTKFQNSPHGSGGILQVAREMYKTGGMRVFYAASVPSIAGQMISTSSKWTIYSWLSRQKNINTVLAGLISGITSSLLTHPLDFVRVHWQMKKPITTQIKAEGIAVLYRGYSKSFAKIAIGSVLFYPLTDFFKTRTENIIISSAASAIISTIIMHPIDYLKVRHIYNLSYYHGFEIKKYYKGLGLNLMRIVPHFVITMSIINSFNS